MAYITVDLDQFDDEDIREEYESRGLGSSYDPFGGYEDDDWKILYDKYSVGIDVVPELIQIMLNKANRIV